VIDLHTHTTASDGRWTPTELVRLASEAGVTVLAVTDHDTTGGCGEAKRASEAAGIAFVPGIEITAVVDGADVHVLGYFVDVESAGLAAFLETQRADRAARVRRIVERLAQSGIELDAEAILKPGREDPSRSPGRPWVARALVSAGHVSTSDEAFERWLERGRPAFVPRTGFRPEQVVEEIHAARGVASLAHPVLVGHDEWLPGLASAGLDAIEAYHSDHDARTTAHYLEIARRLGLAVTGGSDFHGDESHGPRRPGTVCLPRVEFDRLARVKADRGY